jgi:hypothetical protein
VSRAVYILVLVVALAAPALAQASPDAVIRDCAEDGDLDRKYSNDDLEQAENNLPSDLDEYSDCREVIGGAKTGGSGAGGGNEAGGGGNANDPTGAAAARSERAARKRDAAELNELTARGDRPELRVGGKPVEPGSNGLFDIASSSNGLPLPLLLALIAIGLLAVVGALYALRRRIPALARIPLPEINLPRVPFPRLRR